MTDGTRTTAEENRQIAAELFRVGLSPATASTVWSEAVARARLLVEEAVAATDGLRDVVAGLRESGRYTAVLRYLMAPPVSQDRFAQICPEYRKTAEKAGSPLGDSDAAAVARAFKEWQDSDRVSRLASSDPSIRFVAKEVTAALIAHRDVATSGRTASSKEQEQDVSDALLASGWREFPRSAVERTSDVPPRGFMHKVRMANEGGLKQEVDIVCGINEKGVLLALECKVSNDETNSIKRANDVLNKVRAWQKHWGNFVVTGALLQGVFAPNDIQKLLDGNVVVFWHHDIPALLRWLDARAGVMP